MGFLVQNGPAKITREDLLALQSVIPYPGNARPQQALNGRKVEYYSRQSVTPALPYRVQSTARSNAPFHAQPPEWARKEHCNKHEEKSTAKEQTGETLFYNCS